MFIVYCIGLLLNFVGNDIQDTYNIFTTNPAGVDPSLQNEAEAKPETYGLTS